MSPRPSIGLPQLNADKLFLADGGIETTLVYKKKIHLPQFAAIALLDTADGKRTLYECYKSYVQIARDCRTGIVIETRTWRGAPRWAEKVGFSSERFMELNREAVQLLMDLRTEKQLPPDTHTPVVISGCLGPLQDAYEDSSASITLDEALAVYRDQIGVLAAAGVDMLSIMTVTNLNEAVAVVQLAREHQLPVHVSFSLESDGRLLGGRTLDAAIREVDQRTDESVVYFGVNCAHPQHILLAVREMSEPTRRRIGSIRGNASSKSHDELDNCESLDRGDIPAFCQGNLELIRLLPNLKVMGGCCGTDEEHIKALAARLPVR